MAQLVGEVRIISDCGCSYKFTSAQPFSVPGGGTPTVAQLATALAAVQADISTQLLTGTPQVRSLAQQVQSTNSNG